MPKLNHPTRVGRCKNVPDEFVEKFLENGWTKVSDPKPTAKKAAPKPPAKK